MCLLIDNEFSVMPSMPLFRALQFTWTGVVVFGIAINQYPKPKDAELPLMAYDVLLRRSGPLISLLAFLLRLFLQMCMTVSRRKKNGARHKSIPNKGGPFPLGCLVAYSIVTIARLAIYGLHLLTEKALRYLESGTTHLLSDHLVLGASMVGILQAEITVVSEAIRTTLLRQKVNRLDKIRVYLETLSLICVALMDCILFTATTWDMFYTVLYFHPRIQSIGGFVVGSGFQIYLYSWLRHQI